MEDDKSLDFYDVSLLSDGSVSGKSPLSSYQPDIWRRKWDIPLLNNFFALFRIYLGLCEHRWRFQITSLLALSFKMKCSTHPINTKLQTSPQTHLNNTFMLLIDNVLQMPEGAVIFFEKVISLSTYLHFKQRATSYRASSRIVPSFNSLWRSRELKYRQKYTKKIIIIWKWNISLMPLPTNWLFNKKKRKSWRLIYRQYSVQFVSHLRYIMKIEGGMNSKII